MVDATWVLETYHPLKQIFQSGSMKGTINIYPISVGYGLSRVVSKKVFILASISAIYLIGQNFGGQKFSYLSIDFTKEHF